MKTDLNMPINNVDEAKMYLKALHDNNESYHCEDNAHDIVWDDVEVSEAEADKLNLNMGIVYEFANDKFDPCGFLMDLFNAEDEDN